MSGGALVELGLDGIGDHFGRYRLHMPASEKAMARSLRRYGQVSPVVVCLRRGRYELIDGFYAEPVTMRSSVRPRPL